MTRFARFCWVFAAALCAVRGGAQTVETATFSAAITNFLARAQGGTRFLATVVGFQNKTAPPSAPAPDACGRSSAGLFVAEVTQVTASHVGSFKDQVILMNIHFRNLTNQPISLGYLARSGVIVDNLGNRYSWGRAGTNDTSVTGMGMIPGRKGRKVLFLNK